VKDVVGMEGETVDTEVEEEVPLARLAWAAVDHLVEGCVDTVMTVAAEVLEEVPTMVSFYTSFWNQFGGLILIIP